MAKKQLTPATDLFIPSAKAIYSNLLTYFILLVVPLLLSSIRGVTPVVTDNMSTAELVNAIRDSISPFAVVGGLLTILFFAPLTYAELHTAAGKEVPLQEALRNGIKYFWRLFGLIIVTGLLILVGLIAFIIPGLIMIRRYVLAPYFLVDKNLSITQAMSAAAKATKPVSMSIYGIIAVLLLFGLVSVSGLPGLILGAILQVLYSVAFALRYHEVKKK